MTAGASEETPRPQIFGGYVLVKALGRGAMGDVHLARPTDTGRGIPSPVVVKRLHGELANRKGFVSRFKHEAAVAVAVDSPHVARVYDVGAVGETLYICMDYVAGWPLSAVLDAILDSGHHASVASVADLIAGGLAGLHALHTAVDPKSKKPLEIVHRDLSPKNLMVGEDGLMRLIDLGLGKSNAQSWRTRTGVVMGSVGYMPPEQARGERVDARADVYAMGVVAFEMLALRNFIKRGPLPAMMKASTAPTFVPPSRYRPDVPPGLDAVIEKALRIDRDERYPTAQAFLEDLRSVVPPSDARGGMRSLLEDLFGSTRQQREEEIRALMMLPVEGESFDVRPTRVFGMRDGILPPELVPTEHRPNPSRPLPAAREPTVGAVPVTQIPEGTAATELASIDPSLAPDTRVLVKDRPMTTSTSSIVSIKGDTHWAPPKKRSVSVGVFAAGLGIATAVGAIVAVIAVRALEEPVVHAPTSPRRAVVSTPRPSVAELPAPPPPTEPERVAPVEVAAPPPRSRRTRTKPPPEKKVAAPTPDTIERLDARLTALKGRVQKMRSGAPKAKQAELLQLLRDITVAQSSNELEQKRADLARLTRRAKALQ
ncbi:MAG: serine/threonine-protein kinase [Deltaproteobacteria bacterium]